jgi:hypothetical protein
MLMFRGQIQHNRPLAGLTPPVNAHKIRQHPACRRIVNPFALLVGNGRRLVFERLAYALCHSRIHEHTDGHHQQQRHDACRLFEIE